MCVTCCIYFTCWITCFYDCIITIFVNKTTNDKVCNVVCIDCCNYIFIASKQWVATEVQVRIAVFNILCVFVNKTTNISIREDTTTKFSCVAEIISCNNRIIKDISQYVRTWCCNNECVVNIFNITFFPTCCIRTIDISTVSCYETSSCNACWVDFLLPNFHLHIVYITCADCARVLCNKTCNISYANNLHKCHRCDILKSFWRCSWCVCCRNNFDIFPTDTAVCNVTCVVSYKHTNVCNNSVLTNICWCCNVQCVTVISIFVLIVFDCCKVFECINCNDFTVVNYTLVNCGNCTECDAWIVVKFHCCRICLVIWQSNNQVFQDCVCIDRVKQTKIYTYAVCSLQVRIISKWFNCDDMIVSVKRSNLFIYKRCVWFNFYVWHKNIVFIVNHSIQIFFCINWKWVVSIWINLYNNCKCLFANIQLCWFITFLIESYLTVLIEVWCIKSYANTSGRCLTCNFYNVQVIICCVFAETNLAYCKWQCCCNCFIIKVDIIAILHCLPIKNCTVVRSASWHDLFCTKDTVFAIYCLNCTISSYVCFKLFACVNCKWHNIVCIKSINHYALDININNCYFATCSLNWNIVFNSCCKWCCDNNDVTNHYHFVCYIQPQNTVFDCCKQTEINTTLACSVRALNVCDCDWIDFCVIWNTCFKFDRIVSKCCVSVCISICICDNIWFSVLNWKCNCWQSINI